MNKRLGKDDKEDQAHHVHHHVTHHWQDVKCLNHNGTTHEHHDDDVGKSDENRTEKLFWVLMGLKVFMGCRPVPKLVLTAVSKSAPMGIFSDSRKEI